MLGIAVGRIGMSFDDFCGCDYAEIEAIVTAWREGEEERMRGEWERLRTLAAIAIQPHVKKKITPRQLLPLPWDHGHGESSEQEMTLEERKKRAVETARRMGAETF